MVRLFPQQAEGGRLEVGDEILVEQQPPQGVLVCDHAGLVFNKFSLTRTARRAPKTAERARGIY